MVNHYRLSFLQFAISSNKAISRYNRGCIIDDSRDHIYLTQQKEI